MSESIQSAGLRVEAAIPVLNATPGVLRSLLEPLPPAWLDFQEEADAWSPGTVLVHLIHSERMNWIPRARVALSADEVRKFVPIPPQGKFEGEIAPRLAEFAELRRENITTLQGLNLKAEDYLRTAEHPSLGTVMLGQLLATWVVHDLNHIHQIVKTLAKMRTAAVGPWRQYLGILDV